MHGFASRKRSIYTTLILPECDDAMRHMEQCLEALAETSMTAKQKFTLLAIVDDFVFGHALRDAASENPIDMDFAAEQLA